MTAGFNGLRIRLTLLLGGLSVACTLGMTLYINQIASARMTRASGEILHGVAQGIAGSLAENLEERQKEVLLMSRSLVFMREDLNGGAVQAAMEDLRSHYPEYAWMGMADVQGRVLSSTGQVLLGGDVSQRPWFQHGLRGPFVGDVHEALLLARLLPRSADGEPPRFVDFSAPVLDENGELRGVLGGHLAWSWVTALIRDTLPAAAAREGMEVFVLSGKGTVIYPQEAAGQVALPARFAAASHFEQLAWPDGEAYLTSMSAVGAGPGNLLGWRVVLRQPVARALEAVNNLHQQLLMLGGLVTLLAMALAYRMAAYVSRPVEALAQVAARIEAGEEDAPFPHPGPVREIRQLTGALRRMTHRLVAREHELALINARLEEMVALRTEALRLANEELEILARSDALTGLHNRRFANERLREEYQRYRRTGNVFAVLLLDVDHFKRVNDTFGHEVGDEVLKQVAQVLRRSARSTDFVARFGGEEFMLLLPDTGLDGAGHLAEKIRESIAAMELRPVGRVTISIGVAVASPMAAREEDVVRQADDALYRAKSEGRNRVAVVA